MALFRFSLVALLSTVFCSILTAQSTPVRDKNVEAQLIADVDSIQPGVPFVIGLQFKIDPTWHTYWANPGETGLAPKLNLNLPAGFTAGPLLFPVPKKFIIDYGFDIKEAGYGYETQVIHPMTITPPADLKAGDSIIFSGKADWLMCDPNTCIPGGADLTLTLSVADSAVASPQAGAIKAALNKVPETVSTPMSVALEGNAVSFTATLPEAALPLGATLSFYPLKNEVFDPFSDLTITTSGNVVTISATKHESLETAPTAFSGVLVSEVEGVKSGFELSLDGGAATTSPSPSESSVSKTGSAPTNEGLPFGGGLIGMLFAAFLGGIILNIMPCVFPVISLKVMSFVSQSGEDRKKVLLHSLTFALGILIFFWILTTIMLILRNVGSDDLGWGVQLRQPGFVIGLIFVMVLVALSLFGVFEIGTSMTGVGGNLANKSGYAGSFWSGALAVLLATPCTAPLMAPAIGFALTQSAPVMFLVFTVLGLGLAAPYFVFAAFPKLLDLIPAPGAWMETFKQLMGFPMLAVAVWLTGVLSKQLNVAGLQWALSAVLILAMAGWILGRFTGYERSRGARFKGQLAALLVFLLSIGVAWEASAKRAPENTVDISEVIAKHRAEGKDVFVDFTAEWCITCKVNERVTIRSEKVQKAFQEKNIEFVVADWTNKDSSIAKILEEHGRAGVPLYLLYPADTSRPAILVKDGILTTGDVLEALDQL